MFVFNLIDSDTMGWRWYLFVHAHVHTPQHPTQSTTGALLTTALREEQQQQLHGAGTGAAEPCDVRIVGATSLFVPGLPTPQIGGPTAVVPPAGSRVAVEDAEGLARVFGFGGIKGLQQQERDGVRAAAAAASVELLTDDGTATAAVRPGEPAGGVRVAVSTRTKPKLNPKLYNHHTQQTGRTYTLRLYDFPPRRSLTVRLLMADGRPAAAAAATTGGIVGRFASRPDAETGAQAWAWTVGKRVRPGEWVELESFRDFDDRFVL